MLSIFQEFFVSVNSIFCFSVTFLRIKFSKIEKNKKTLFIKLDLSYEVQQSL